MLREIGETLVLTIVIFLIVRLAVQNFKVSGISMLPTVHNGDLVLVNKVDYTFESPGRGDVIVFKAPPQPSDDYIKRVIGVPGDLVRIRAGKGVWVNNHKLAESYIAQVPSYSWPLAGGSKRVPRNDYFVLGDNRNNSYDSHAWGYVPRKNIIGKALVAYWPVQDIRFFSF